MMRALLMTLLLGAAPAPAAGAEESSFAWSWALEPAPEAPAWRVRLDTPVMNSLHRSDARDLQVVDADGKPVPHLWLRDGELIESLSETQSLAYTTSRPGGEAPLEPGQALSLRLGDTRLTITTDATRGREADARVLLEGLVAGPDEFPALAHHRLELDWSAERVPERLACTVTATDAPSAPGQSMTPDTPPAQRFTGMIRNLRPAEAWHLQCRGRQLPDSLRLDAVRLQSNGSRDHRRTITLQPAARPAEAPGSAMKFELPGPYRARAIRLDSSEANLVSELRVQSRIDEQTPWQDRARLTLSTLPEETPHTQPLKTFGAGRHTEWRLLADPPLRRPPEVTIEAIQDEILFFAQGTAPWRILTGSRQAVPEPRPARELLARTRDRLGPAWEWPLRTVSQRAVAGGPQVLEPEREWAWSHYLLWLTLVVGAALVAWLATRLLRSNGTGEHQEPP